MLIFAFGFDLTYVTISALKHLSIMERPNEHPHRANTTDEIGLDTCCATASEENVKDEVTDQLILVEVRFHQGDKTQETKFFEKSCTVDEYMKWKYVLQLSNQLEQINVDIKEKLSICAVLKEDGTLWVERPADIADIADMDQVCNAVVEHVLIQKGFTVESLPVDSENREMRLKEIREMPRDKMNLFHCEILSDQLFVIYLTRNKHKVSELFKQIPGKQVIKLPFYWHQLGQVVDLEQKIKHMSNNSEVTVEVTVNAETRPKEVGCSISGPVLAVQLATRKLYELKLQVKHENCDFEIVKKEALGELYVEDFLNKHLQRLGLQCCAVQEKRNIKLFGIDEDAVVKGLKEAEHMIIEKPVVVMKQEDKLPDDILEFAKSHEQKIVFYTGMGTSKLQMYVIGVKDIVETVVEKLNKMQQGRSVSSDDQREHELFSYIFKNENLYQYFMTSTDIAKEANKNRIHISSKTENGRNVVIISGEEKNIEKGLKLVQMVEKSFKFESEHSDDNKICELFSLPVGKSCINECAAHYDVMVNQTVLYSCCSGRIQVNDNFLVYPNATESRNIAWCTDHQKSIHVTTSMTLLNLSTKIVEVSFRGNWDGDKNFRGRTQQDGGLIVDVRVPLQSDHMLEDILKTIFSRLEEKNEKYTVVLLLETPLEWTPRDFIKSLLTVAMEVVLDTKSRATQSICLVSDKSEMLDIVASDVQSTLNHFLEGHNKERQLKVLVVEGELNQAKVSVVVNTTSKNLDLKNGKVSSMLLDVAGPGLQQECRTTFPRGIKSMEIAVTSGHKLPCEKVFHVALDKFDMEKVDESIEGIRNLVFLCLDKANEMEMETIAFPVLGTGLLEYPIELVGAAMFEGVKRYRANTSNSSLTEVQFIVYHSDHDAMMSFRTQEKIMAAQQDQSRCITKTSIEWKICGSSDNVKQALRSIRGKSEELLNNPDEDTTDEIELSKSNYLIVSTLYRTEIDNITRQGVVLRHENDFLMLKGKRRALKEAMQLIQKRLADILHIQPLVVDSVKEYDELHIEREVETVNSNRKEFACVYDRISKVVKIYGTSESNTNAQRVLFALIRRLADQRGTQKQAQQSDRRTSYETKNATTAFTDDKDCQDINRTDKEIINDVPTTVHPVPSLSMQQTDDQRYASLFKVGNCIIYVYKTDILQVNADCLINPANAQLNHFGGLAYQIAKSGGGKINIESAEIIKKNGGRDLPVSTVVSVSGFGTFKMLLHAVGPCWYDYNTRDASQIELCKQDLKKTVSNCFKKAESGNMKSIAVPTISSGVFAVPKDICAAQYAEAVLEFSQNSSVLKEIHFVDIDDQMVQIMLDIFIKMFAKQSVDLKTNATSSNEATQKARLKRGRKMSANDQTEKYIENTKPYPSIGIDQNVDDNNYWEDEGYLKCSFSRSFHVWVHEGDIMELGVDALVCSENRRGDGNGFISNLIKKRAGPGYMSEKLKGFSIKRKFGDVVICPGGETNFQLIVHAVVPQKDPRALHMMYNNIFEEVMRHEAICSMAITLLGTGTNYFCPEASASILLAECEEFCNRNKEQGKRLLLHLVLKEKELAAEINNLFRVRLDAFKKHGNIPKGHQYASSNSVTNVDASVDVKYEKSTKVSLKQESQATGKELDSCVICMDSVVDEKKLKCGHVFCKECIEGYFRVKMVCPTCGQVCGVITGDQPDGTMEVRKIRGQLAGYAECHTIAVTYLFQDGIQGPHHPNPKSHFRGISRTAYLPDNKEGQVICGMLTVAFKRRLVFTIGTSRTTGEQGVITWNDIHHKTDTRPNTQFGYPDATYLQRVREELEIKGVTKDDVGKKLMKALRNDDYRSTFSCSLKE